MKPLEGLLVLEFSQFLAGPSAGLKLADMGARVIKIERPEKGEAGRQIAIKNLFIEGDSLVFHTINRNKESYAANLKDPVDLNLVKKLIKKADVITHNFRPGTMEKIGLDFNTVSKLNPQIVYAVVTGYGNKGPWASKPGQDLLVQSLSGLTWLSGTKKDGPVAFGLAVADMICGAHLTQGILAGLLKRKKSKKAVLVEVSLLESVLDLQFEFLTTYLNDGGKLPQRGETPGSGHAYLSAPYGIYKTKDAWLALAMGDLLKIGKAIGCSSIESFHDKFSWFEKKDEIAKILSEFLLQKNTTYWIDLLNKEGIWCSEILNYNELMEHDGFKKADLLQKVNLGKNDLTTTRCPIRIDESIFLSEKGAPKPGADNKKISREFKLQN